MAASDQPARASLAEPVETAIGAVVAAAALAADRDAPAVAAAVDELRRVLVPRLLPAEPTPAIRQVLGIPNFVAGPHAHLFRAAGVAVPRKSEEEQAFVLFRFLPLALEFGDGWKDVAADQLMAALAVARSRQAGGAS